MSKEMDKSTNDTQLFSKVAELIDLARKKVASAVNLTMVHTYFEIGRMIVEDEQQGKERAEYGKQVLKELSNRLTAKYGKGFSVENLNKMGISIKFMILQFRRRRRLNSKIQLINQM
jgi:ribosomal protein L13E